MKRIILFTLIFAQIAPDDALAYKYYVIEHSAVPLQVHNSETAPGIVTEVLKKCAKNDYDVISYPFSRLIREMKSTRSRWINFGSPSWPGIQSENLSEEEILSTKHYFISLKRNKVNDFDSLVGKTIILIKDFDYPGLKSFIEKNQMSIFYVLDIPSALKAIELGRGDVFPEMDFRLFYHIKNSKLKLKEMNFLDISRVIPVTSIHFSFSENFPQSIKTKLNKCLISLKSTGAIDLIKRKYKFDNISFL